MWNGGILRVLMRHKNGLLAFAREYWAVKWARIWLIAAEVALLLTWHWRSSYLVALAFFIYSGIAFQRHTMRQIQKAQAEIQRLRDESERRFHADVERFKKFLREQRIPFEERGGSHWPN